MAARIRHWHAKVVGVTRPNADGSDRQAILQRCSIGEGLVLEHEEDNPVDRKAVAVKRISGEQLGYLPADLAREVVGKAQRGYQFAATITDLTGGRGVKANRGANLSIFQYDRDVTHDELHAYAQDHRAQIIGDSSKTVGPDRSPHKRPMQITGGPAAALVLGLIVIAWLIFG